MAPIPGLLPPPCPPPFVSPPAFAEILKNLNLDPTSKTHRDANCNLNTTTLPGTTIYPPGYDTLSLHSVQPAHSNQQTQTTPSIRHIKPIHHTINNQTNHNNNHTTPLPHNPNQDPNPSHTPLTLLLFPLFILLLLTTIYILIIRFHKDSYSESDSSPPSSTHKPFLLRPSSPSSFISALTISTRSSSTFFSDSDSYSSHSNEKNGQTGTSHGPRGEGRRKLTGEELNERSSLLDKYNGPNTHVFEHEWEVDRYCRVKGYGACSVQRKKLACGFGEGVGLLVVLD